MSGEADDVLFMRAALDEAALAASAGEVPVGAVIVRDGVIVARAHNQVEGLALGTAHAEMLAIREASRVLGMWRLDGCSLYVTKEPCAMCAGAMVCCRVPRLIFGCPDPRAGAAGGSITVTSMPGALHTVQVTPGVLADECRESLRQFFQMRRASAAPLPRS